MAKPAVLCHDYIGTSFTYFPEERVPEIASISDCEEIPQWSNSQNLNKVYGSASKPVMPVGVEHGKCG
jgi:hypothetical protein